jgi:hypothetical protein
MGCYRKAQITEGLLQESIGNSWAVSERDG